MLKLLIAFNDLTEKDVGWGASGVDIVGELDSGYVQHLMSPDQRVFTKLRQPKPTTTAEASCMMCAQNSTLNFCMRLLAVRMNATTDSTFTTTSRLVKRDLLVVTHHSFMNGIRARRGREGGHTKMSLGQTSSAQILIQTWKKHKRKPELCPLRPIKRILHHIRPAARKSEASPR